MTCQQACILKHDVAQSAIPCTQSRFVLHIYISNAQQFILKALFRLNNVLSRSVFDSYLKMALSTICER
jgi:hypothetical protein